MALRAWWEKRRRRKALRKADENVHEVREELERMARRREHLGGRDRMERGGRTRELGRVDLKLTLLYLAGIAIAITTAQVLSADVVIDHTVIRVDGETANGVLFNDGNSLGTDAGMSYNPDTDTLTVVGNVNAGGLGAVDDDPNNAISGYLNTTGDPTCTSNCGVDEICLVDANTPYGRGPVVCRGNTLTDYALFEDRVRGFDLSASWSPPGICDTSGEILANDPNDLITVTFNHPFTVTCNSQGFAVSGDSDLWRDTDAFRAFNPLQRLIDVVNGTWNAGAGDRRNQVDGVGAAVDGTRRQILMGDGNPDTASADPNVDPDHNMFRGVTLPLCDPNEKIDINDTDPNAMPTATCGLSMLDSFAQIADLAGPNQIIQRNGSDTAWIAGDKGGGSTVGHFTHVFPSMDATWDVVIGIAPAAITLTSWACIARGGSITSATLTIRECDEDGASCVGSGGSVIVNALDTQFEDLTFTDAAIDPNDAIELLVPVFTGTPTFMQCTLSYTYD